MLSGDNGILKRAGDAKNKTTKEYAIEKIRLAANSAMILREGSITYYDLKSELDNQFPKGEGTGIEQYEIEGDETVAEWIVIVHTEEGDAEETIIGKHVENLTPRIEEFFISGTPATNVELPSSDFEKVNGTEIDNSYVAKGKTGTIYENDEFVWVPVDRNQQFTVKIEGEGNIKSIIITNPVGNTKIVANNVISPQNITGISPEFDGKIYNGVYKVAVETEDGNIISKYLGVHSLYAIDTQNDWKYGIDATDDFLFKNSLSTFSDTRDTYALRVEENGGFWIGRYEVSYKDGKAEIIPSTFTRTDKSVTLINGMLWNFIKRSNAFSIARLYNNSLNSSLTTGAAWDRTLGWIYEKRDSTGKNSNELVIDSSSWGNYYTDTFSETTNLINTGAKSETKANNIYDLAGNLSEWLTLENKSKTISYICTGGSGCWTMAPYMFAGGHSYTSDGESPVSGFRIVLFK